MPAYVHFKADGSQYSVNAKLIFRCTTLCLLLVVHKNTSQFKNGGIIKMCVMVKHMQFLKFRQQQLNTVK